MHFLFSCSPYISLKLQQLQLRFTQFTHSYLAATLRFIINGEGGQNKWGGFKDFEKLINGGVKISRGVGTKKKRDEIELSLLYKLY